MKSNWLISISVIFYFSIFIFVSMGDDVNESCIPDLDKPPIVIPNLKSPTDIISDNTPTNLPGSGDPSSTYSKGSYYISSQGPDIIVEKNIKTKAETYYKNDNISIRLKIFNCNLRNRLEEIQISEEIPNEFEIVEVKPNNHVKHDDASRDPKTIEWQFTNNVSSKKYLEYTVRTNKSGKYIFTSPILKSKIMDQNGRFQEAIGSNGNIVYITVNNREPTFGPVTYPDEIKVGDDAEIKVLVWDPDFDNMQVYLTRRIDDVSEELIFDEFVYNSKLNKTYSSFKLNLNTSEYNGNEGLYQFSLMVTDGDNIKIKDIEIDIHKYPLFTNHMKPSIDTTWNLLSGGLTLATGIWIGRNLHRRNESKLKNTRQSKLSEFNIRGYKIGGKKIK